MTSVRLSDDDDTPQQMNLFFSGSFGLNRFIQLKSLTLYHISSNEMIKKIILQFNHLSLLTHFNLIDCHVIFHQKTQRDLINRIWRLPKLTHCHLDLYFRYSHEFFIPTVRSKSIEYLCIEHIVFDSAKLIRLFRCTPNIRHLNVSIDKFPDNTQFPSVIESISSLKLIFNHLTVGTINLLKNMPNLTNLNLHAGKHQIHGHQWKQFIIDYLPKLKIFRFLMLFHVNNEDEINEIIDSYRTPFWLIDHQWFIRCHWTLEDNQIWTYIYTLPYSFSFYSYILKGSGVRTKSTCPNENDYCSYNRVTTLKQSQLTSLNGLFISNIRFHNIRHLEVSFPLPDQFLSVIPRLDQLISLNVSSESGIDADIPLSQLQILINRAPRLYLLTIAYWDSSIIQDLPLYITSNSIGRLDLQSYHYSKRDRCFNNEQCAAFIRSPLAKQCEILQIVVDNRSNIDYLINGMDNLQALKVVFQSDQWNNYFPTIEEHITWMSSGFSRTFTENLPGTEIIRLWIR